MLTLWASVALWARVFRIEVSAFRLVSVSWPFTILTASDLTTDAHLIHLIKWFFFDVFFGHLNGE